MLNSAVHQFIHTFIDRRYSQNTTSAKGCYVIPPGDSAVATVVSNGLRPASVTMAPTTRTNANTISPHVKLFVFVRTQPIR